MRNLLLVSFLASLSLTACGGSDDSTNTASTSTGGSPDAGAGGSTAGAAGSQAGSGGTKAGAGGASAGAGGAKAGAGGSQAGAGGASAGTGGAAAGSGGSQAGAGGTTAGAGGSDAGAGGSDAGAGGSDAGAGGSDAGAGGSDAGAGGDGGAGGSGPSCTDLGGTCVSTNGPPNGICPGGTLTDNPSCPSSPLPGGGQGCCIPGGAGGNAGAGGDAGAGGSAQGGAGAGGQGEGGNCPDSPPTNGMACSLPAGAISLPTCSYGDNVQGSCRQQFSCFDGQWADLTSGTICPPPGQGGCPQEVPVSGAKCDIQVTCGFPDGSVCGCAACHGGACIPETQPTWACGGPPTNDGCPTILPNAGAACAFDAALTCMYPIGGCGGYRVTCQDGSWSWQEQLCP